MEACLLPDRLCIAGNESLTCSQGVGEEWERNGRVGESTHMHTHTHAHMHTHTHIHTHPCTCTHTHIPIHTHAHTHTRTHTHAHTHAQHARTQNTPCTHTPCTCMHTHTHKHTHTCIHTQTPTHLPSSRTIPPLNWLTKVGGSLPGSVDLRSIAEAPFSFNEECFPAASVHP